jgi:hypothetical protein
MGTARAERQPHARRRCGSGQVKGTGKPARRGWRSFSASGQHDAAGGAWLLTCARASRGPKAASLPTRRRGPAAPGWIDATPASARLRRLGNAGRKCWNAPRKLPASALGPRSVARVGTGVASEWTWPATSCAAAGRRVPAQTFASSRLAAGGIPAARCAARMTFRNTASEGEAIRSNLPCWTALSSALTAGPYLQVE